jgi:Zn-dependent metalloprotease
MSRALARVAGVLTLIGVLLAGSSAAAQAPLDPLDEVRQAMAQASGAPVDVRASRLTGLASFVRAPEGIPVAGASAEDRALDFLGTYARAFGLSGVTDLRHVRSQIGDRVGMDHVRFRQVHAGVPVTGAELIVHLRGNRVTAVNGRTLGTLAGFSTTPGVPASAAITAANDLLAKRFDVSDAVLSEPRLEVFDRPLIGGPGVPTRLAWFVEATRVDLRQFIWVDAETGGVLVRFSQLTDAKSRKIYDANNGSGLPGALVRSEGQGPTGDTDADLAYDYSGDTYDYFFNQHGRDSYDGQGAQLKSTVHYCPGPSDCPYPNAFWNGIQMVYGEGFSAADDVDAHELTHAVTEHSANLFYYMQSGALNESYSDIFGETVDQLNGDPGTPWLMGEDVPGFGAIRNMMDPNQFGDPESMSDAAFFKCFDSYYGDNGGVHSNSGVPNRAYALMVDGDGGGIVAGIGLVKAGLIQYRALTSYLTSASDFLENYDALNQSCQDLIGTGGITLADCNEVTEALDAVEMSDPWPCSPAQPSGPALCAPGLGPVNAFKDDLENTKSGNWTTSVQAVGDHWKGAPRVGTPAIHHKGFATSGIHSFWGYDAGVTAGSAVQMTKSVLVPAGTRMQFNHSWGFENDAVDTYDGGVLEYSTNNGASWTDAGALITAGAFYNGSVSGCCFNPLAGRNAFVGESWGYTATQLDLSALAGQNVRFRFRIGTDFCCDDYGWFIDDVRIFTCDVGGTVEFAAPVYAGGEAGGTASISVTRTGGLAEGVTVDYFSSDGTASAPGDYSAVAGSLSFDSGVTTRSFNVPIVNDTVDDDAETVGLTLTNVQGPGAVLGGQNTGTLIIGDDDVGGTLQFKMASFSVSEGSAFATITVTRTGGSASGVSVDYQSADGSAVHPDDYAATSGTLSFGAKVTSQTFTVPIVGDTLDESNETLTLTLSNPQGGALLGGVVVSTLTITDNDTGGSLQIGSASYSVSEGGGSAIITVTRTKGAASNVTVDYATADGTATAGADYTASAGTLSFGANEMSKTFAVPILEDVLGEDNETVLLSISNPTGGATLGTRTSAPLNILENETVLQYGAAQYAVGEASSKVTITVKRSGDTTTAASVDYATADATAQAGSDYATATGTLSFPAKTTSKTFTISILQDAATEPPEAVSLSLLNPVGSVLGPQSASTLTISDDEPQLYFSAASYSGKEGGPAALITVKRSGNKTAAVSVDYATSDGTATDGADYTAASGTLSFGAGKTSLTFLVPLLADTDAEAPETVHLTLSNPVGATLGLFSALLTITDDEPTVGFSVASYSVSEASATATVTVKRSGSTSGTSTVDYATSDGTAVAGVDYTAASGTLTFLPKATSQTFTVPIIADGNAEPAETVNVTLSNVSPGTGLALANATLNITNDDPSISFSMAAYTAKESAKSLMVTVKRTGNVTGAASVDYATSDGSASAGADYAAASGTLSFAPKITTKTFSVTLLPDTLDEGNETIDLALTNPVGGVLGQDAATIAITDDDNAGVIELASASFSGSETGGTAVITVKRSGGTASAASIDYATSDGSAVAGDDYTATSGTLTFLAGQTSKTFGIPILTDGAPEPTETLTVTLSNPGGGAALGPKASAETYIVSAE